MTDLAEEQREQARINPGLQELFNVSLMTSLQERRTRRIARGMSVEAFGLSHHSEHQPKPLSPLEEAVLIVSTGPTGPVMHDGPLVMRDGRNELGTPFMNAISRAAPSPDNAQAAKVFMINDEGVWLIKSLKPSEARRLLDERPRKWDDWSEQDWLTAADTMKIKVHDRRLEFPREWPFYIGWNKQISNVPGTTIFFPVVDCTWQYINAFLIIGSEPDGQRPIIIDDWRKFHPKSLYDWAAWAGSHLRISTLIPYHPVGGTKYIRSGYVNPNATVPLGYARTWRTDHDAFFVLQNLALLGEAMGLGSWTHASVFPPYVMERDESKGWYGLGFRKADGKPFRHWPPLPAPQPNFVGIDGILEGCCPPYVSSMDEAVDKVVEAKYSGDGVYSNPQIFSGAYKEQSQGEEYLKHASHYSKECVKYAKDVANYIWETYGRFPAHLNSFYVPGIWTQFAHLETDYYDKFMDPSFYPRQAAHDGLWDVQA
jgi:hypothetical protein